MVFPPVCIRSLTRDSQQSWTCRWSPPFPDMMPANREDQGMVSKNVPWPYWSFSAHHRRVSEYKSNNAGCAVSMAGTLQWGSPGASRSRTFTQTHQVKLHTAEPFRSSVCHKRIQACFLLFRALCFFFFFVLFNKAALQHNRYQRPSGKQLMKSLSPSRTKSSK